MLTKLMLFLTVSRCCAYNVEVDWSYILTNPDYAKQEREAYFGYTVALVTSGSSAWALVGAPRANDTRVGGSGVTERGAVYLCSLPAASVSCRQLTVTTAANGSPGGGGKEQYINLQDYGWLGGSLDLRQGDSNSVIATCSPRWINQQNVPGLTYFLNGACYLTTVGDLMLSGSLERQWSKVVPLVYRDLQVISDGSSNVYYYQLGQAGLSVHVPEGSDEVWLGAPGMQQWTGSVAKVSKMTGGGGGIGARSEWLYTNSEVFKPSSRAVWDDYFGYSVGSGRFFGLFTNMVAGSPRHDLIGKVSVFSTSGDQISVHWEETGPQIGAAFGAALATGDVNGDGWSELFVGAPLYSDAGTVTESGLVVIYSRKSNLDDLEEGGRLMGSSQAGARFGSALMVVGDLDRDGYQDLAVGAPYEASGAGAVYIYRGTADGLQTTVSQKLVANDVHQNLRGFGVSISRSADVDNNGYSDIAVGAHEGEGSAVVLRTRPVLQLQLDVSAEYKILTEIGITFNVTSCVYYNGYNILDETGVTLSGQVDSDLTLPRAVFVASGTEVITSTAPVTRGHKKCFPFPVKIKDKITDYSQPLKVTFEAEVTYNDPGCEKCGLISPASNYRSMISLPLALGCGTDAVCTPELQLQVSWRGASHLALRSGSTVTLSVVVIVAGKELSYLGRVRLLMPKSLTAHQPLPYECARSSEGVSCELPNPMAVGEKKELEISLEESGSLLEEGDVMLQVIASASGAEDVKDEIALSVIEDVVLELHGQAEDDLIQYVAPPASLATSSITYQIINNGNTRVNEVRLDINIPTGYDESTFAKITQQATSGSIDCSLEGSSSSVLPGSPSSNPPYKTTAKLVCGQQPHTTCHRVICRVRQVHLAPLITVEVDYNITVLSEIFGNNFTLALYTNALATYDSVTPVLAESGIWTTLLPNDWVPLGKSTPAWAYVVAVLVGLLILAAVVVILVKIGFFKRKRPGQDTAAAEEDVEGEGEAGGETAPLQTEEHEGEVTSRARAAVEAEAEAESESDAFTDKDAD